MRRSTLGLLLVLGALLPLQAQAKKPHKKTAAAPAAEAAVEIGPAGVVDDFHELLRQGRRAQVLALLAPDAVIFETGYAGQSRDDYAQNHVSDDADFAGVIDYHVIRRQVMQDGNTAWVMTQAALQGIFGDQNVDLEQTETMILRRLAGGWQIVHIHWSAHSRPQQEADVPAPASAPVAAPASTEPAIAAPAPAVAPIEPEAPVIESPPSPELAPAPAPAIPAPPAEEPAAAPPPAPPAVESGKAPE